MSRVIGILGGISPASTARYYELLIQGYYQRRQDYHYPEIVIYSLDFQRFTDAEDSGDQARYVAEIVRGVRCLERAGADLALLAANSPHAVLAAVQAQVQVPLVSIVTATAQAARQRGLRRLLLLGIRFTMQASFYPDTCREYGLEVVTPTPDHQDEVNAIIFSELVRHILKNTTRDRLLAVMGSYDVDGVILGCTELPLLVSCRSWILSPCTWRQCWTRRWNEASYSTRGSTAPAGTDRAEGGRGAPGLLTNAARQPRLLRRTRL